MKTALVTFALLALVAAAAKAQSPLTANRPVRQIETGTYVITDRGPHHRVWERTDYETTPAGNRVPRVHRFRELASGLHYWNGAQNTWMEAKEEIVSVP